MSSPPPGGEQTGGSGGGGLTGVRVAASGGRMSGQGAAAVGGSLAARSLPRSLEESSTKENLVGGQERSTGDTWGGGGSCS